MDKKTQHIFAEDMTDDMCAEGLALSAQAFNEQMVKGNVFGTVATIIRTGFDKKYGRGWNCVVGRNFGAYVTHEIKTYMYFTVVPGVYILLWRA